MGVVLVPLRINPHVLLLVDQIREPREGRGKSFSVSSVYLTKCGSFIFHVIQMLVFLQG